MSYKSGNHLTHFFHHCKHVFLGFLIVVIVQRIPHQCYRKAICLAYIPMVVCLFVLFIQGLSGHGTNDGARWLFGIQPSELAKGLVVMLVALLLSRQGVEGVGHVRTQCCMVLSALMVFLIFPENGSTAVLLSLVVFLMLLIGRGSKQVIMKWVGCGLVIVGVVVCAYLVAPESVKSFPIFHRLETQIGRVSSWTEKVPAAKYVVNDNNRQRYHAMRAITTSGILGKGPGNSVERDELSQAYSDLIFAVIVEELGLLPASIVVLCYFWLLLRTFRIAQKCTDLFHSLLVVGLGILIVSQALFNIMVAVDMAPITGQTLPFISRGGTSIIVNCIYLGIILHISHYVNQQQNSSNNAATQAA
ncbi:MAG: FtsW/RodA/SpoVE family cell cycle protein [Bacteroidales bacterium]|nr:FtsW/RodA/SpoVE family cell cycle protein [Bacteroidales bacterium]